MNEAAPFRYTGPTWEAFERLENRVKKLEVQIDGPLVPSADFESPVDLSWLDLDQRSIRLSGERPVILGKCEFRFLELLCSKPNRWVWNEDIVEFVWYNGNSPANVCHSIRNLAYELRSKIHGTQCVIENIHGRGWRLRKVSVEQSAA